LRPAAINPGDIAMRIRQNLLLAIGWLGILLLSLLLPIVSQAEEDRARPDKTEAPYFFVHSDDPGADRMPLKSTAVDVHIAGVIADVKVVQRYKNEGTRPIEAQYVFPGSTRAALYAMNMRVGDRLVVAQIREKGQARKEYQEAKQEGKTASLLEQQRPNVFQMKVANILPGDDIAVELSYTELLLPSEGKYQFVYPAVVGPRYNGSVAGGSGTAEKWLSTPYLHAEEASKSDFDLKVTLNSGIPIKDARSETHQVDVHYDSAERSTINLMKSDKSDDNRDFILDYRLAGDRVESGLMLYRGKDENFFLAMLEPPAAVKPEQVPGREYIFIVDVSGSMFGFPLDTAKTLLADLIGHLRPTDTFNVMLFSGGNRVLAERSLPASRQNIDRALKLLREQQGGGATELLPAMKRALAMPKDDAKARSIVVVTDGYVTVEKEVFDLIRQNLDASNLFAFGIGSSVNRFLMEGMARAGKGEPFIVTNEKTAKEEAARFRRYIESPVLSNIKVRFDGFDAYDVEPVSVPDVFSARPVIVFGKWRGQQGEQPSGTVTIEGMTGEGRFLRLFNVGNTPPSGDNSALRYLWARSRIATLADYNKLSPDDKRVAEVTRLGLAYNLLTEYTSFIAVDQVVRNAGGKQDSVNQPLPMPEGVSDLAVGGEVPSTPEPETYLLIAVMLSVLLWMKRNGKLDVYLH
jgi:Ca-activated chloride channel family protein